jgi:hypothetical protein
LRLLRALFLYERIYPAASQRVGPRAGIQKGKLWRREGSNLLGLLLRPQPRIECPPPAPRPVILNCPFVRRPVLLSRDPQYVDYLLLREGDATCSNIHDCVSQYGDIKNIPSCLLHEASKFLGVED